MALSMRNRVVTGFNKEELITKERGMIMRIRETISYKFFGLSSKLNNKNEWARRGMPDKSVNLNSFKRKVCNIQLVQRKNR